MTKQLGIDDIDFDELEKDFATLPSISKILNEYFETASRKQISTMAGVVLDCALAIGCIKNHDCAPDEKFELIKEEISNWSSASVTMRYPCLVMANCCRFYIAYLKNDTRAMSLHLYDLLNRVTAPSDPWIMPDEYWKNKILKEL